MQEKTRRTLREIGRDDEVYGTGVKPDFIFPKWFVGEKDGNRKTKQ